MWTLRVSYGVRAEDEQVMAKVKKNDIMEGLSGRLGKQLVIRHMRDGRTIVLTRPDFSNRVFSEDQLSHQSRFQQAAAYASMASKTNPLYAQLAAGTSKNAYNLALSDWFNPPVVHQVRREDSCIRVHASDNVLVTKVVVTLLDEQGHILEQAEATLINNAWWEYNTSSTTQASILVEAFDLAGNVTRHESE